jgi:predicted transcriptional regulator of viral defense system
MLFATLAKLSRSAAGSIGSPLRRPSQIPIWRQFAIRVPRAVICLISALAHHGLTTQVPHAIDIALPTHAQVPKVDGVPLRVFWYPELSFRAGVDVITVDDVPVQIYSPEKTIADCFKYRNKIGTDVAVEALRAYRELAQKPKRAALTKFAQIDRVQRVMRPYLEAIL